MLNEILQESSKLSVKIMTMNVFLSWGPYSASCMIKEMSITLLTCGLAVPKWDPH